MPIFSPLSSVSATRSVLEAHGLATKKALGQHFLVNDAIVGKILDLAEVEAGDCVLEVGPGIGTLTCALLARGARVVAIERDALLLPVLEETCALWAEHICVLNMDALDVTCETLAQPGRGTRAESRPASVWPHGVPADFGASFTPTKFVANLPYAVAATLVLDYFQRFSSLEQAIVMVQAEVADRMMAQPGSKDYGAYTVKLGLYAQPQERFKVGPGNFFPPPHVGSAVVRLNRVGNSLTPEERMAAATMADAAFANRRKTILNSCKTYFAGQPQVLAALPAIFEQAGIDPHLRGEALTLADFITLGKLLLAVQETNFPFVIERDE